MINVEGPEPRLEPPHLARVLPVEMIYETQLNPTNRDIYNDILASIGIDSPNIYKKTWRGMDYNQSQEKQLDNTPICNSANSLMALGKYVLTPRQARIWELRNISALRGQ